MQYTQQDTIHGFDVSIGMQYLSLANLIGPHTLNGFGSRDDKLACI